MAGGVITAAWVQSVPVWIAAGAGIYGLTSWREQRRGERLLKHAEKALGTGRETVMLVRAIRSKMYSIPEEEASDPVRRRAFKLQLTSEAVERAQTSWVQFNRHYSSARMFTAVSDTAPYPPEEIYRCMVDLWVTYRNIDDLESYGDEAHFRDEIVEARQRFLGRTLPGKPDVIGDRLAQAEKVMERELEVILRPPTGLMTISKLMIATKSRVRAISNRACR